MFPVVNALWIILSVAPLSTFYPIAYNPLVSVLRADRADPVVVAAFEVVNSAVLDTCGLDELLLFDLKVLEAVAEAAPGDDEDAVDVQQDKCFINWSIAEL